MYRTFAQLREGWTKNLALLFPGPGRLAVVRLAEFSFVAAGGVVALTPALNSRHYLLIVAGSASAALYLMFLKRIRTAHFGWASNLLAIFGLPLFSYLLWRSRLFHEKGTVAWKGRLYATMGSSKEAADARPAITPIR
jgi:hypothetical protein